ncbi:hypothetical protein SAMN03159443_00757 [Pseudomonas sp. NFACC15-1]|nr:hypothetical protein SAMN03159443_00757 [Pseudomonas sp. NFACC15-1]SDB09938.1 hypothetical protein SAMN03159290_00711 [Pseudomonas sp. NFACC13-1]SDX21020.1 hypothetical protein SAMN03159380_01832 [Pseudomonas sp. NFACC14]
MPECFDSLDEAFAAIAQDKEKKRLWTVLTFAGSRQFHLFWSAANAGQIVAGILNQGLPASPDSVPQVLPNKGLPQQKQGGVDKSSAQYLQNEINRQTVSKTKALRANVADVLAQQWKVNTWTFTGHAEERMLLNFDALYTQYAVASGQIPTVTIYNSDSPCTVDDPRASSLLQPRSCSAKLTQLAKRYPFAQFTVFYYKAYHGSGLRAMDGASSSSSAGSTSPSAYVVGSNIELLPFTAELRELCAQNKIK